MTTALATHPLNSILAGPVMATALLLTAAWMLWSGLGDAFVGAAP